MNEYGNGEKLDFEGTKTDAIFVSVEDDSGVALDLFVPYSKPLIGRIKFGEPFSRRRDLRETVASAAAKRQRLFV